MAYLHSTKRCAVRVFFQTRQTGDGLAIWLRLAGTGLLPDCDGKFEVAHMFGRRRDPHDAKTALCCLQHHQDIDQTRSWFRALSKPLRLWLKSYLAAQATAEWEALPDHARAHWDVVCAARRVEWLASRRERRAAS